MNEPANQDSSRAPPSRLFRKYLYSFVALAFAALAVNTALEVSYREQKQLLAATQREQAASAAIQIGQFIGQIESQLKWLSRLPTDLSAQEDERLNFIRLLRLSPAVAEIATLDARGRELVRVSRRVADKVGSRGLAGLSRRQGERHLLRAGLLLRRYRAIHDGCRSRRRQ